MVRKGEVNRQLIIDSANQLFYQKGYNQTSFSEIADAAGMPRGNFYYYFKSKDEILDAVITDRIERMRQRLAEWDKEYSTPLEKLHRFIDILLNSEQDAMRYGCPMGSLSVELGKTQLEQQARVKDMFDIFLEWGTSQFKALGTKQPRTQALHLLASMQGTLLVANTYSDVSFLRQEAAQLKKWVGTL